MRNKVALVGVCLIFTFILSTSTNSANAIKYYNPAQLVRYPWGDATATTENPFTALAFRQAMAMAFDYDAFLTDVVGEAGFRLEGMIPKGMFGHHNTLLEEGILPTYQPDAAKALFTAIGWTGTIVLSYNIGNVIRENVCLNLKTSIEAMNVGIAIEVQGIDTEALMPMIQEGSLPLFVFGWDSDYADPDNYVMPLYHSEVGYFTPMTGYANPVLNTKLEEAAREIDVVVREQLYNDIEEMSIKDMAWLYLYQGQTQSYPRAWLEGVENSGWYNPMGSWAHSIEYINKTDGGGSPVNTFIEETIDWPGPLDTACGYKYYGGGFDFNPLTRETLLQYRYENNTLYPALATGYESSEDAKNITFYLRRGVSYHDGSPFNAYTMKYSIDRAVIYNDPWGPVKIITPYLLGGEDYFFLDNPNVSDAIKFLNAGGITADNEFALTIHQAKSYVPILHALQHQVCSAVSAKDVIENAPADYTTDANDDDFGQVPLTSWFPDLTEEEIRQYLGLAPDTNVAVSGVVPGSFAEGETGHDYMNTWSVGTGPYKMITFDQTNYIAEFEKNTNWWGDFAIQSVDYIRIYGGIDMDLNRIQDLLAGDCDVTYVPTVNLDHVRDPITDVPVEGLQHFEKPTYNTYFACFNLFDEGPVEFMQFNGSKDGTVTANGDQRTETTTLTKTTTEHYTNTFTNERFIPGFEIVFTLSWFFLVSVIILLHRREKDER
ncbi:MAG: ABC transporter substrate-binding protein [Promethearchaeota archaeon]